MPSSPREVVKAPLQLPKKADLTGTVGLYSQVGRSWDLPCVFSIISRRLRIEQGAGVRPPGSELRCYCSSQCLKLRITVKLGNRCPREVVESKRSVEGSDLYGTRQSSAAVLLLLG